MALPRADTDPGLVVGSNTGGRALYTRAQLYDLLGSNGFSGDGLDVGAAIVLAESGGRRNARNVNNDHSIDRGLWQLNSRWHSEVSDACAYNPGCATRAAAKISKGGTDFHEWATYTSGAYKKFYKGTGSTAKASGAQATNSLPDEPVTDAVDAVGGALSDIANMFSTLFQASTWFRIGKVVLGGVVLIFVAYQLVR